MKSNTLKVIINRPIDEVFEFTTNPNNTDKWFLNAGKEWTNEWPRKLGTVYENNNGFLTVTEFELNKLFTLTKKDKFFVRYTYRALDENSTEMTYYEESLDGDLESITDMEPMETLKRRMETIVEIDKTYNIVYITGYDIEYENNVKCIKITPESYRMERPDKTTFLVGHDSIMELKEIG